MPATRTIRAVGAVAIPWNAIGVTSYLAHVGVIGSGGPPPGGADMPAAVVGAFAICTFGGLVASVGLALLRRWARPLFWIALVATVIDWGWVLLYSGAASVPLGVAVLVIALLLALLGESAHRAGQLS
jgi:hypothetical protein